MKSKGEKKLKRTGSMTILEHIAMAMEDLENEKILDTPDNPERLALVHQKRREWYKKNRERLITKRMEYYKKNGK